MTEVYGANLKRTFKEFCRIQMNMIIIANVARIDKNVADMVKYAMNSGKKQHEDNTNQRPIPGVTNHGGLLHE